ncbi:MAG: SIR2 family protein [Chloroflexi bacterium]|nr:SIR2 family protein [Chloroflexota bacterium]
MQTIDVLRLLLGLFANESDDESGVSVVPIVVDEFDRHGDLIRAALRAEGVALLLASEATNGVDGTIDTALKAHIEAHLQVPRVGGGSTRVKVHRQNGIIRATIDGHLNLTNSSHQQIAGVAVSLFSDVIQNSDTAFIVYNDTGLDEEWAQAIWRLFGELHGMPLLDIRQLFILIERRNRPLQDYHLNDDPSLSYLVTSSQLMPRKPTLSNTSDIHHIARQARENGLVLFLGAGFSKSSNLPLGDSLRDDALRTFLAMPDRRSEDLCRAFYDYAQANERLLQTERDQSAQDFADKLTLERVLREEFWRSGMEGSPTLQSFAELNANALNNTGPSIRSIRAIVEHIPRLVLITVNFDSLVEMSGSDVYAIVTEEEFEDGLSYIDSYFAGEDRRVPFLKLHGSIEFRSTIVATIDQTASGLTTAKDQCVRGVLREEAKVPWIYVGYSMRDPDLWSVFQSKDFIDGVDEYWVAPFEDRNIRQWCEKHRQFEGGQRKLWERSITLTSDRFLEELLRAWSLQHE